MPDGRMALLEGGPDHRYHCETLDLILQLTSYMDHARTWIRPCCVPLTAEQSKRLTAFALAADGRRFAVVRMVMEVGPFRLKGPLRTPHLGHPVSANFDPDCREAVMRQSYYCSELVTEACVAACLLDPETTRPPSMYPCELFFGTANNRWIRNHLDMSGWAPPSRWTPCPGTEPCLKNRPWLVNDTSR